MTLDAVVTVSWGPGSSRIGRRRIPLRERQGVAQRVCLLCPPRQLGTQESVTLLVAGPTNDAARVLCLAGKKHDAYAFVVHWLCAHALSPSELKSMLEDLGACLVGDGEEVAEVLPPERVIFHHLGGELSRIRREKELSLAALASRVGISDSTLCRYETGEKVPALATLVKLCWALDLKVGTVFNAAEASWRQRRADVSEAVRKRQNDLPDLALQCPSTSV